MANESQLAFIISQALYVGSVYGAHSKDSNFDEQEFKNYARGMMRIALKELNLAHDHSIEKALNDFMSSFNSW